MYSDCFSHWREKHSRDGRGHPLVGRVHQVLLASVLCGRVKEYGKVTDKSLVRAPADYDSVRGGPHSACPTKEDGSLGDPVASAMRVVYDTAQVYPMFVVTYIHTS